MRTGKDYISGIDDKRRIYLDGKLVENLPHHPAFRGIIGTIARLYEFSSAENNGMTFKTEWGTEGNKVFLIPRKKEELAERHDAIYKWASLTHGFVGRSPDHVGGFLAGFASNPSLFSKGETNFSENVSNFYRKVVTEDLYVTYAIIPPQIDRSKTAHEQENRYAQVGVVSKDENGIVVRGAQMLATGAAISDFIFVSCIPPLRPGDEDYALSFVLPVDTHGLKLYCRRPFAVDKPSIADYPLSTQFDESDAFLVFDDVFVPWKYVFVFRDVQMVHSQFFMTPAHVLGNNQAQIRLSAKLKFIIGVARKVSMMNGIDKIPSVVEKLGELATLSSLVEGMVLASESKAISWENGTVTPNPRFLYGAMGLQSELYPRVLHLLRDLCGAGVLQLPSSYMDFISPETGKDIETYIKSPGNSSEDRIKLFKLAWDLVGTEFAGRHYQYEMFYAGAPFVAKNYSFRNYGYEEPVSIVDKFLSEYSMDGNIPEGEK